MLGTREKRLRQCKAPTELVKPGSGQQYLTEFDHLGCFLCERVGDLLWADHVICNPYASETKGKASVREGEWQSGSEESWRRRMTTTGAAYSYHPEGKTFYGK